MNKKTIISLLIIASLCFGFVNQTLAKQISEEKLLKSAIVSLLLPQIANAFKEYYGPKGSTQFYCEKINIKQPPSEVGSNYFEIDMEAITFEGPHAPPHNLINIKFTNFPSGNWKVKNFHSKRLTNEEAMNYKCN